MATLIRTNGSEEQVRPADGKYFTLEELQRYVGGFIEAVALPNGKTMIVNEEGKLDNLPYNQRATLLGAAAGTMPGDEVMGDVLVLSDDEWET